MTGPRTLADLNAMPGSTRDAVDTFYGIRVRRTVAVGGHAGRSRRTGTRTHLVEVRTVIEAGIAGATSPIANTFRVGQTLSVRPLCQPWLRAATVIPGADVDAITCRLCGGTGGDR